MRKLVYAINVSLDGCCDHTKMAPDEDLYEYHLALLRDADVLLYGRITYELMVPYWPDIAKNPTDDKEENDFAQVFDAVPNIVVVSRSLEKGIGTKTRIVRGNLQAEISKMKQEEGKNILVGGVDLPSQLIRLGLVDEYHLVVLPTIVGAGRRLFDGMNLPERLKLKLAGSKICNSGAVALRYVNS